ncbi:MAG: tRNA pseudouridine(55) synthase TruB [Lentisphaeria bacterium]|nr:tRNA pseudouridine(55) synthase TruB [Lentisphaeria bacterium]
MRDDLSDSGLLLVDKPEDWTSHDVVNCIRGRFRVKKVGHCGTLDPIATGLLLVVLGRATKLSQKLTTQDKIYEGVMRLGVETFTEDRAGEVTATAPVDITPEDVRRVAAQFTGELLQTPPMVSAIKKDGKKLYKLARQGVEVEREARPIVIHSLDIDDISLPEVTFRVHCSKGTYVRTLCADMGRELGCGGHMRDLRRTMSSGFKVEDSCTIDEIKSWEKEQMLARMIPLGRLLVMMVDGQQSE